jgi:hypothetical protein
MALDKAGILKAIALKTETVAIEGGEVLVTEITAKEYMDIYNSPESKGDDGEFDGTRFTSLLVARCIVVTDGNRLMDDADAELLRNGSTAAYTKLAMAVQKLNGLGLDEKN